MFPQTLSEQLFIPSKLFPQTLWELSEQHQCSHKLCRNSFSISPNCSHNLCGNSQSSTNVPTKFVGTVFPQTLSEQCSHKLCRNSVPTNFVGMFPNKYWNGLLIIILRPGAGIPGAGNAYRSSRPLQLARSGYDFKSMPDSPLGSTG